VICVTSEVFMALKLTGYWNATYSETAIFTVDKPDYTASHPSRHQASTVSPLEVIPSALARHVLARH
jgi:hypothetical protein